MQFIAVRDLREKTAQIWRELSVEKEMVITSNGKPIAVLSSVNEKNLEESLHLIRRARAIASVDALQKQSVKQEKHKTNLEQINTEIKKTRQTRPR